MATTPDTDKTKIISLSSSRMKKLERETVDSSIDRYHQPSRHNAIISNNPIKMRNNASQKLYLKPLGKVRNTGYGSEHENPSPPSVTITIASPRTPVETFPMVSDLRPMHFETNTERHLSYNSESSSSETDTRTPETTLNWTPTLCGGPAEYQTQVLRLERKELLNRLLKKEERRLEQLRVLLKKLSYLNDQALEPHVSVVIQKVHTLEEVQEKFLQDFRQKMADPSASISSIFPCLSERQYVLCSYQHLATKLAEHLPRSHQNFEDLTIPGQPRDKNNDLRKLLRDPLSWIADTMEDIRLLAEATPANNPDMKEFEKLYKQLMTESIESHQTFQAYGKIEIQNNTRRLLMHSLVVELVNPQTNDRKIRYLLLFSDILVCAKIIRKEKVKHGFMDAFRNSDHRLGRKLSTRRRKEDDDLPRLETRWMIPLTQISFQSCSRAKSEKMTIDGKLKSDQIKDAIIESKRKKAYFEMSGHAWRCARIEDTIIKLSADLALQKPQLVLSIAEYNGQSHHILLVTERERTHWRSEIETAKRAAELSQQNQQEEKQYGQENNPIKKDSKRLAGFANVAKSSVISQTHSIPSAPDMNNLLKSYQHIIRLNKKGLAVMYGSDRPGKTGILRTTVHGVTNLNIADSYHVWIEVDSFGQFEELARTRVVCNQLNPEWNQTFDLRINDAHTICFSIYRHSDVFAELEVNLTDDCICNQRIKMPLKTVENFTQIIEFSFTLSMPKQSQIKSRPESVHEGNVFGKPLEALVKVNQEGQSKSDTDNQLVPKFVIACTDEIERRGLREVGVYRICGSLNDIEKLKQLFDKDQERGIKALSEAEIADITSLLKQFFRELPGSLLTDYASAELMKAVEVSDEASRILLVEDILRRLPPVNRETFKHLILHLLTIVRYEDANKMNIGNLSILWSTILFSSFPAETGGDSLADSDQSPVYNSLNREAAITFQQTKTLNMIFRAVRDGKIEWTHLNSEENVQCPGSLL